jgi:hypothetical protein
MMAHCHRAGNVWRRPSVPAGRRTIRFPPTVETFEAVAVIRRRNGWAFRACLTASTS